MEKHYAKVKFSFGTYTFYTYDNSLVPEDMVVCLVKNYFQVGEFLEYTKVVPPVVMKPIFGTIEGMVMEFEQKEKHFKKQEDEKNNSYVSDYNKSAHYKKGDCILANDGIWEYDGNNFIFICSKKEWDEENA